MEYTEVLARIGKCAPLIKNWEAMAGIDFDYQDIRVDGVLVDRHPDLHKEGWEISLLTTMHTRSGDAGKQVCSVRWQFRDRWGNLASFSFKGHELTGSLRLTYIDYDDFAIVGFAILDPDGSPVFAFPEPDEIAIHSVTRIEGKTPWEIYPENWTDDTISLFPDLAEEDF